jgi:hypothetical protein
MTVLAAHIVEVTVNQEAGCSITQIAGPRAGL